MEPPRTNIDAGNEFLRELHERRSVKMDNSYEDLIDRYYGDISFDTMMIMISLSNYSPNWAKYKSGFIKTLENLPAHHIFLEDNSEEILARLGNYSDHKLCLEVFLILVKKGFDKNHRIGRYNSIYCLMVHAYLERYSVTKGRLNFDILHKDMDIEFNKEDGEYIITVLDHIVNTHGHSSSINSELLEFVYEDVVRAGIDINEIKSDNLGLNAINIFIKKDGMHATLARDAIELIIDLCNMGIDLEFKDRNGLTVLQSSIINKNWEICIELIKCGSDIWCKTPTGESIMDLLVKHKSHPDSERGRKWGDLFKIVDSFYNTSDVTSIGFLDKLYKSISSDVSEFNELLESLSNDDIHDLIGSLTKRCHTRLKLLSEKSYKILKKVPRYYWTDFIFLKDINKYGWLLSFLESVHELDIIDIIVDKIKGDSECIDLLFNSNILLFKLHNYSLYKGGFGASRVHAKIKCELRLTEMLLSIRDTTELNAELLYDLCNNIEHDLIPNLDRDMVYIQKDDIPENIISYINIYDKSETDITGIGSKYDGFITYTTEMIDLCISAGDSPRIALHDLENDSKYYKFPDILKYLSDI